MDEPDEYDFRALRLEHIHMRMTELADEAAEAVTQARQSGLTWQQIGAALGITKQAAQQRYGRTG